MKRALSLSALCAAVIIVLPSCKKDYTCKCTDNKSGAPYEFKISDTRKPQARITCEDYSLGYTCTLQ